MSLERESSVTHLPGETITAPLGNILDLQTDITFAGNDVTKIDKLNANSARILGSNTPHVPIC